MSTHLCSYCCGSKYDDWGDPCEACEGVGVEVTCDHCGQETRKADGYACRDCDAEPYQGSMVFYNVG